MSTQSGSSTSRLLLLPWLLETRRAGDPIPHDKANAAAPKTDLKAGLLLNFAREVCGAPAPDVESWPNEWIGIHADGSVVYAIRGHPTS